MQSKEHPKERACTWKCWHSHPDSACKCICGGQNHGIKYRPPTKAQIEHNRNMKATRYFRKVEKAGQLRLPLTWEDGIAA